MVVAESAFHLRFVEQRKHHSRGNFFDALVRKYREAPKERGAFVEGCVATVTGLLPGLREEYTEHQVPHVLQHSCEEYKTKADFRQPNGENNTNLVLVRARTRCRYFAKLLADEYLDGQKDYGKWCEDVWGYLKEQELSPFEARRRIQDVMAIRKELDDLKEQAVKAHAERVDLESRNALKKELQAFGPPNVTGSPVNVSSREVVAPASAEPLDREHLNCCPKDCKLCDGFKVVENVVRVALQHPAVQVKRKQTVAVEGDEESDDDDEAAADDDDEEDEEEEADDSEEEEDEEEDEEEEGDDAEESSEDTDEEEEESLVQLRRGHARARLLRHNSSWRKRRGAHHVQRAASARGRTAAGSSSSKKRRRHSDFYRVLVTEFERSTLFPTHMLTEPFIKRCTGIISELMPDLQQEYTWKQVPSVLISECDVYASKEDFQTKLMRLEHAKKTCVFFANRLGDEFKHKRNYRSWCGDVYAQMLRSSNATQMTDRQKKLLETHPDLSRKVYARQTSVECCPANCRRCE